MQVHEARAFCEELGIRLGGGNGVTEGWLSGSCPFAFATHGSGADNHPSFGIRVGGSGPSYFKCFTCGQKGTFAQAVSLLGYLRDEDLSDTVRRVELAESAVLSGSPSWRFKEKEGRFSYEKALGAAQGEADYPPLLTHPYLTRRGISWRTALRMRLRWDGTSGRVLFPVYDYRGVFLGFSGRTVRDSEAGPRVRDYSGLPKAKVFLGEHLINRCGVARPHTIIIVEGLFDYAAVLGSGAITADRSVFAILGTELTQAKKDKLRRFGASVIWMVDRDAAGDKVLWGAEAPGGAKRSRGVLAEFDGCFPQYVASYPESGRRCLKDPGECTASQIRQMIGRAKCYLG
jgi:hypothetical protein